MTHQHHYRISGTNNSNDLQKIKNALLGLPGVNAVDTTMEPPMVSITVEKHPDLSSLQNAVSKAGDFTITEQSAKQDHSHSNQQHGSDTMQGSKKTAHLMLQDTVDHSKADHSNITNGGKATNTVSNKMEGSVHQEDHSQMDHSKMDHSKMKMDGSGHPGHGGHDHAGMINDFKKRFFVVLILTLPIILLSPMIQHWLGVQWQFPGSMYILFGLSTVVFFFGGWPFLKGWYEEMKTWKPGMMTLIGFAISVAYVYSVATVFGLKGMDFFWELTTLIVIMLLGHWIEMKSIAGASKELELLVQLMPAEAHLINGATVQEVKTESLKENDIILIKPGEKIAGDGILVEGESYLNESMISGESKPVLKTKGDKVIAGSLNGTGSLKVQVTHGAKDSYLSQVIKLVQDVQNSKSNTQLLADKAAQWLTIVALLAGAITFFYWYLNGQTLAFAIERMVTVIVICCPHALGLAVPLVVAKSTALSAKNGLLIKNRTAFENSRKISTLVFDKTGTLTVGKFEVSRIVPIDKNISEQELIRLSSALEQNSEHPIATGIIQKVKESSLPIPSVDNFKAITGKVNW